MILSCVPFYFDLHGVIKGRISGPTWLMDPVVHEFAFFRDPAPPDESELDLDISLSISGTKDDRCGKGLAGEGIAWSGKHLVASWRAEMETEANSPMKLRFSGNKASRFIVAKWIVEPAIRMAVEARGCLMAHAACVTDGKKAVLVAGEGGAGKTTFVLDWLSFGHPYLSDDFSLVRENSALPYPTPLRLGAGNLLINDVLSNMAAAHKMEIFARTALRRLTFGKAKFYFKAPIQTAVPGISISGPVPLAGAILLRNKKSKSGAVDPSQLAEKMAEIDMAETHGFGISPGGGAPEPVRSFHKSHRARLSETLSGLVRRELQAPVHLPEPARQSVEALLEWAGGLSS